MRLRKNRNTSEIARTKYENTWEGYREKQKEVKGLVNIARVKEESPIIKELWEKGRNGLV